VLKRPGRALVVLLLATACGSGTPRAVPHPSALPTAPARPSTAAAVSTIPTALDAHDLYAADRPGLLSAEASHALSLIYVPDDNDGTVHVIDPTTFKVVRVAQVGRLPQHVTPSYDLRTLWVDNDLGNSLTPIDPRTGRFGTPVPVADPYNLYFTADGTKAIVVAEHFNRLDFRDPHSFALIKSVQVPCRGVDHMDYTADGRFALASCEFSGQLLKVDLQQMAHVLRR